MALHFLKVKLQAGEAGVGWIWAMAGQGVKGKVKWGGNEAQADKNRSRCVCGVAPDAQLTLSPHGPNGSFAVIVDRRTQRERESCGRRASFLPMCNRHWQIFKPVRRTLLQSVSTERGRGWSSGEAVSGVLREVRSEGAKKLACCLWGGLGKE